jgi:hypothetical protein
LHVISEIDSFGGRDYQAATTGGDGAPWDAYYETIKIETLGDMSIYIELVNGEDFECNIENISNDIIEELIEYGEGEELITDYLGEKLLDE